MSDIIRVEYEDVNAIASRMVEKTEEMMYAMERLRNAIDRTTDVWVGEASDAMRAYFESAVVPVFTQINDLIMDKIESLRMATDTLMDTDESLSRIF